MRTTGYIPSPSDPRDRPLSGLIGAVKDTTEALTMLGSIDRVYDQLHTNSCVLQAIKQQHWMKQGLQGTKVRTELSSAFGYWNSRRAHGMETVDIGTVPRLAFKSIASLGVCSEPVWPFVESTVNIKPTKEAYRAAFDQKWLDGYYAIWESGDTRIDLMRKALSNEEPVVLAMWIGKELHDYSGGVVGVPKKIIGGHMVCAVGYEPDGIWVVNSWGENWGIVPPALKGRFKGGFAMLSWDLVRWPGVSEIWAVRHAQEF